MPTYDYECLDCSHEFEEMQKMLASPLVICPKCGKDTLKRKIGGGIGLNFVGSGFYCTDYPAKGANVKSEPKSEPKAACCPCGKSKTCS